MSKSKKTEPAEKPAVAEKTQTSPTPTPQKSSQKKTASIIIVVCVSLIAVTALVAVLAGVFHLFSGAPALQLSQRDVARKNDIARLESALVQYQTNNAMKRNNLPAAGDWDDFLQNYNLADLRDPNADEPYAYHLCTYGATSCVNPTNITTENLDEIYLYYGATCASAGAALEPASPRRFAILTPLENAELYCVNN